MSKAIFELIDVLRAEIADLYRLRADDAARLDRLERRLPRPANGAGSERTVTSPDFGAAGGLTPSRRPSSASPSRGTPEQSG